MFAGEWYYTTHFGDPHHRDYDNPDNIDGYTPQQWQDRKEVLFALIDSVPSSMLVTVYLQNIKCVDLLCKEAIIYMYWFICFMSAL